MLLSSFCKNQQYLSNLIILPGLQPFYIMKQANQKDLSESKPGQQSQQTPVPYRETINTQHLLDSIKKCLQAMVNNVNSLQAQYQQLKLALSQKLANTLTYDTYTELFMGINPIFHDLLQAYIQLKADLKHNEVNVQLTLQKSLELQQQLVKMDIKVNKIELHIRDLQSKKIDLELHLTNLQLRKQNVERWLEEKSQLKILNHQIDNQVSQYHILLESKQSSIEHLQRQLECSKQKNVMLLSNLQSFESKVQQICKVSQICKCPSSLVGKSLLSLMECLSTIKLEYKQAEIIQLDQRIRQEIKYSQQSGQKIQGEVKYALQLSKDSQIQSSLDESLRRSYNPHKPG